MDDAGIVVRRGHGSGELPAAGSCSSGAEAETISGNAGEAGAAAEPARPAYPYGAEAGSNPRCCEADLPGLADRLRREGTPITRYRYPEAVFGERDRNVRKVKAAAAKAGRTWRAAGGAEARRHREYLARLAEVLRGTETGRLRYWAGVTMLDGRWCGASGAGGYWAVASRLVNEQARAELRRRGDAWRAAGLGPIATIEAVREAGLDEAGRPARGVIDSGRRSRRAA